MTLVNIDPHVILHQKTHVSAVLFLEPGQLPIHHPVYVKGEEEASDANPIFAKWILFGLSHVLELH